MKARRCGLLLMALALLGCGGAEPVEMTASVRVEREYVVCSFEAGERGSVAVILPPDAAAGDFVSSVISVSETEDGMSVMARDLSPYVDYSILVSGEKTRVGDHVLGFRIPEGRDVVKLELLDPDGQVLAGCDYAVSPTPAAKPVSERLTVKRLRGLLFIGGDFDGRLQNTRLMLNGEELDVMTESPRLVMSGKHGDLPPRVQLTVLDGERLHERWIPSLRPTAEASKQEVVAGERVEVRVQACGLSSVTEEDSPEFSLTTWMPDDPEGAELHPLPLEAALGDCAEWSVEVTAKADGRFFVNPWVQWR